MLKDRSTWTGHVHNMPKYLDSTDTSPLSCPQNQLTHDAKQVYENLLENIEDLNKASWHHTIHHKFNNSKLKWEMDKKGKELQDEEAQESSGARCS